MSTENVKPRFLFFLFEDPLFDAIYFVIIYDTEKLEIVRALYNEYLDKPPAERDFEILPTEEEEEEVDVGISFTRQDGVNETIYSKLTTRFYDDPSATDNIIDMFLHNTEGQKLKEIPLSRMESVGVYDLATMLVSNYRSE